MKQEGGQNNLENNLYEKEDFYELIRNYILRALIALSIGTLLFVAGQFYWWLGAILLAVFLIGFVLNEVFLSGFMVLLGAFIPALIIKFMPLVTIRKKNLPSEVYENTNYLFLAGLISLVYFLFLISLSISLLASFFYVIL